MVFIDLSDTYTFVRATKRGRYLLVRDLIEHIDSFVDHLKEAESTRDGRTKESIGGAIAALEELSCSISKAAATAS